MPEKPGSWRDITASVYCIPGIEVDGSVVNQAPKSSLSIGTWREGSDSRRQQQEGRWHDATSLREVLYSIKLKI